MKQNPESHDCSNYPVSSCRWCERAHLVARWWRGVYDSRFDVIPLAKLPIDIVTAFLDYFDSIITDEAAKAVTRQSKQDVADLYDVARIFIDELKRRRERRPLARLIEPGWMATQ